MENIITCISLSERRYRRRSISFSELIWKPMHHCQEPFDGRGAAGKRVHLLASFKRWRLTFSQARTDQSGYDSTITNTHTKRLLRQLHQLCTLRRLGPMKSTRAAPPANSRADIANIYLPAASGRQLLAGERKMILSVLGCSCLGIRQLF